MVMLVCKRWQPLSPALPAPGCASLPSLDPVQVPTNHCRVPTSQGASFDTGMHPSTCVRAHTDTHTRTYRHTHVHTHTHTHVHTRARARTDTHTHTHTRAHSPPLPVQFTRSAMLAVGVSSLLNVLVGLSDALSLNFNFQVCGPPGVGLCVGPGYASLWAPGGRDFCRPGCVFV